MSWGSLANEWRLVVKRSRRWSFSLWTIGASIMGEMYSILRVLERRNQNDSNTIRRSSGSSETVGREIEAVDRSYENFLADEPVLRDLLRGTSTEHDLFEVVCTINRLVFFYVIIRWINLELWIFMDGNFYVS